MDSISLITASPRTGGPSSPAQVNSAADHGAGERFDNHLADKVQRAEIKEKPADVERVRDQAPKQKNQFDITVKDENLIDGGSRDEIDLAKAKMGSALNRIEASISAILSRAGIPYPDVRVMSAGNIMVSLPQDFMEDLSAVVGVFIAEFDHLNDTNFAKGLQMLVASIGTNASDKLDLDLEGISLDNPYQVIETSLNLVAAAMGVERPPRDVSLTHTQAMALSQHELQPSQGEVKNTNNIPEIKPAHGGVGQLVPDTGTLSPLQAALQAISGNAEAMQSEFQRPDDAVRDFLVSVSKTGEFTKALNKSAEAVKALGMTQDLNKVRPDGMVMRLEVLDAIQQTQPDQISQKDFENLITKTAAQGKPGGELSQSSQAARFANLINGQIKNASWNESRARVQLSPRGLGDIEIDVQRDAAGNMRATIRVENPMVLEMLREEKTGLHTLLESRGFNLNDSDLNFEEFEDQEDSSSEELSEVSEDEEVQEGRASGNSETLTASAVDIQV